MEISLWSNQRWDVTVKKKCRNDEIVQDDSASRLQGIPVNMQGAEGAEYVPMKVGREFRTNETPGSPLCSW
jgi:hypothetical protein